MLSGASLRDRGAKGGSLEFAARGDQRVYTPLRRQTEEAVGGRRGKNAGPERTLAPAEQPALGGGGPHYFCFSFASRCLTLEGTAPQSEAAGAVTMSTTGAESIRDEEAAPGPVAVTGHGGVGGKTATTSVPGGEAWPRRALPRSFARHRSVTC